MNVYVESNFVLEHGLQQEESDSCEKIIRLAISGQIKLFVPAFSLAEPHQAIAARAKARARLGEDLRGHLGELARSKPYREIGATFNHLSEALLASRRLEREGLRSSTELVLRVAEVIPLTGTVLQSAATIEAAFDLSGQDAIVLASVLDHLGQHNANESCLLNRNSKDFGTPAIRDRLEARRCKLFVTFTQGLEYIVAQTRA